MRKKGEKEKGGDGINVAKEHNQQYLLLLDREEVVGKDYHCIAHQARERGREKVMSKTAREGDEERERKTGGRRREEGSKERCDGEKKRAG